ncbi:MAG: hypothetical protein N2Z21_03605 [Candidatus Sumerlaeaceae bacterium]|nr:hypothetical protein [Candidatus Sumerlaeaceae bacterium]
MKTIEELYGPFGQEVVAEVRRSLDRDGSLAPLLSRLNIPPASTLTSQHEALRAFLYQYGIALFLRALRTNMTPSQVEAAKGELLLSRLVGDTRSHVAAKPSSSSTQTSPKTPAPATANTNATKETEMEKKTIVTPTYTGPDRRSGKDRRRNVSDRRTRLELIYENKRFGGRDRRKWKRREEDRKKS